MSQSQSANLNFAWIPCTTFQPYREELTWTSGIYGEMSSKGGGQLTLQYVLKSLTVNARKAFTLLASLQLKNLSDRIKSSKSSNSSSITKASDSSSGGVEFIQLAHRCRESFIAHSDAALKTLLVEFVDHKLITYQGQSNKSTGNVLVHIDLDEQTLQDIVNGKT
jgi:origin recognition complex subunit 2